jgi:hypothetical protein
VRRVAAHASSEQVASDAQPVQPLPVIQLLPPWNRDEWDVALNDGAVYRIFQDRERDAWFIDAIAD